MSPTDKDKRNQKQITQERAERKRSGDLTSIEPLDRELLSELVTKLLNYISCDDTPEGVEARGALIQLNTHASILLTLKDRTGLSKLAHETEWRLKRAASKAIFQCWPDDVPPPDSPPDRDHEFWAKFVREANDTRPPSKKEVKADGKQDHYTRQQLTKFMRHDGRWHDSIRLFGM